MARPGLRFYVGGPAYRLQFHLVHLEAVVGLTRWLSQRGHGVVGMDYAHTSILPQGRADWLYRAMTERNGIADYAIGIDADTGCDGRQLGNLAEELHTYLHPRTGSVKEWAMAGVCVPQRDGRVNAWAAAGERLPEIGVGDVVEVHAIGPAIAIYNLAWYRRAACMDTESERYPSDQASIAGSYAVLSNRDGAFMGEDYWHCEWIRRRRGVILATRLDSVKHAGAL